MSATLGLSRESVSARASAMTLRLYTRHGQRVLTFCLSRLRNPEDAQDAAQTTFMYVLRALERGVVPRHELAWLLKIADNVCHSFRRSLGRRMAATSPADVTELEAAAGSLSPETSEQRRDLREALEDLPENQRRAVLLREWQGLSYAEIAHDLRLSVPAVEALLFRARRALGARLERTRTRLMDLGFSLPALRSLLQSAPAKLAVATTAVGIAAAPAIVEQGHRHAGATRGDRPVPSTAAPPPRPHASAPQAARSIEEHGGAAARLASAGTKRRSANEAAARAVTGPAAPSGDKPSAPSPGPAPPATGVPAATPPAPPIVPAQAPRPPDLQPVVEPVTAAVSPVVAAVEPVTQAVAAPPVPPVPVK